MTWFVELAPAGQALLAGCFTWAMTAAGAAMVVFFSRVDRRMLASMLGLSAGIMLAASYWSLLAPSIQLAEDDGMPGWIPAVIGFLLGGIALRAMDVALARLRPDRGSGGTAASSWHRTALLVAAITLHNIPEGLAGGVAFGAAASGEVGGGMPAAAAALALGIGVQNFPEGAAVAFPLRQEGLTRGRAMWYGQLSGAVEPVFAVIGALLVVVARPVLPYALSFAAGAMIFVVLKELVPESQADASHHDIATLSAMAGFAIMMTLDVAMG